MIPTDARRAMTSPAETSDAPIAPSKNYRWLVPLIIACVLGVFNSFGPTIQSGFQQMQANPIDTRFNHYVLEHTFQWVKPGGYVGTLWSPAFFYPAEHALAFSDNLLGSAPVYWMLRLLFAPATAFSMWMIGCCVLCFAAFAAL